CHQRRARTSSSRSPRARPTRSRSSRSSVPLLAHKTKIDRRFDSAQRMSGSHPLLQVHRVIKELRIALVLSHHDGNTPLTDHRNLLHYFLFKTSDLGNTP